MAKKNRWAKIMAFLALFWIIIWVIWTWALFLFGNNGQTEEQTITPEQYRQLQQLLNSQTWAIKEAPTWAITETINTETWVIIETNTWEVLDNETINSNINTWTWEIK